MRFPAFPVLALALCVASAMAQSVETVTVNDAALTGLWKIGMPEGFSVDFLQRSHFQPMKDSFCHITQTGTAFAIACLDGGLSRSGSGTVEGNKVHIAWGSMMARTVIDGVRADNHIDGRFAFKLSGISHEDTDPSHSERLTPSSGIDGGGKGALLQTVLKGKSVARDDAAIAKNGGTPVPEKLGAIQIVAYLGQAPKSPGQPDAGFFTVYAVEFDNGERICGLHQRDDGVIDAFRCI